MEDFMMKVVPMAQAVYTDNDYFLGLMHCTTEGVFVFEPSDQVLEQMVDNEISLDGLLTFFNGNPEFVHFDSFDAVLDVIKERFEAVP